jgi:acetyltransferase-like isoleucine patch superfamily enzyme
VIGRGLAALLRLYWRAESRWSAVRSRLFAAALVRLPGVVADGAPVVRGVPLVELAPGATLRLGRGVTLNSRNRGYHLSMYAPVKLLADRPGAVIEIGDETRIHGSCIHAYARVRIGRRCLIAANVQIFDGSGHDLALEAPDRRIHTGGDARPVEIGDDVWLGAGCVVMPGVRIGRGSVVAAGSVVSRDLPAGVLAGGVPARVLREAAAPPD